MKRINILLKTLPASLLMAMALVSTISCGGKEEAAPEPDAAAADAGSANQGDQEGGLLVGFAAPEEIIMEAENATVEEPMAVTEDQSSPDKSEIYHASGGKFVLLPDGVGKGEGKGGKTAFKIDVKKADKYAVWARVKWKDGCGNSFNLVMDDGPVTTMGEDSTYGVWHWIRIRGKEGEFRLAEGDHTLEFRNREDGVALDQILLTTNLDEQAQPQGILNP